MSNIKGDPLDLLLRIQQAQTGEDYGTGMFSRTRAVAFSLGNDKLVMPMSDIREIVAVSDLTPVPAVKPWVIGVTSVRGEVITVVDLAGYFGQPLQRLRDSAHVMLINARGFSTGLLVTRILGLRQLPDEVIDRNDAIDAISDSVAPCVSAGYRLEEDNDAGIWGQFDLSVLTGREDFINVAETSAA